MSSKPKKASGTGASALVKALKKNHKIDFLSRADPGKEIPFRWSLLGTCNGPDLKAKRKDGTTPPKKNCEIMLHIDLS